LELGLTLNIIGAVIGCATAVLYALRISQGKEPANLATWAIVWVLDIVGLYLAYATGNHEPYIQIGWVFAASLIVLAAWKQKGDWVWSKTESWVLTLCTVSMGIWVLSGDVVISLGGYILAAWLSAVPQARDYIKNPKAASASAWVWQVSIVSMAFTLASKFVTGKTGAEHTLVYYALTLMNIVMAMLCMRGKRCNTWKGVFWLFGKVEI
jgi:hypothetical protein